jgi:hypothetical protein
MKIRLSRKLKQAASALLVVMVLGGILCLSVIYYLSLIQQQNILSVRSQAWNIAIAISEAGIEEALQVLNRVGTPKSADGWQLLSDGCYWRTNTLADGNRYEVAINMTLKQIVSRGYVGLPAMAANRTSTFFAVAGVSTVNVDPATVNRAVRVTYLRGGLFLAPLVAKHQIDLKGNGVLTDSFDSEDLWKSYYGHYDADVYSGDKGDIASNDSVVAIIGIGNAEIYGKAHTGAEGTVTINGGWVGPHPKGVAGGHEEGWILQDANFTFPDTWLPYSSGLPLGGPATIVTVTYDYIKTMTNSSVYPALPPWSGVTTNVTYSTSTSLTYPVPAGTVTNTTWNTTTFLPSPVPTGTITNTTLVKDKLEPPTGTYIPPFLRDSGWYVYWGITGYTWPSYTYTWPVKSYTYALCTTNSIYTTNYYDHVVDVSGGKYYVSDYDSMMKGSTLVTAQNAQLVLPNGLSMSGNDMITIAPGGSVEMFCGGSACSIGGNGVINKSGYAKNFTLECTPSVTTFNYNGNGEFIGVLLAPEADMALNGGGNVENDFIGCLMMKSISLNGHYSFHYDEALARLNKNPRVLITSWNEIP